MNQIFGKHIFPSIINASEQKYRDNPVIDIDYSSSLLQVTTAILVFYTDFSSTNHKKELVKNIIEPTISTYKNKQVSIYLAEQKNDDTQRETIKLPESVTQIIYILAGSISNEKLLSMLYDAQSLVKSINIDRIRDKRKLITTECIYFSKSVTLNPKQTKQYPEFKEVFGLSHQNNTPAYSCIQPKNNQNETKKSLSSLLNRFILNTET